jgi:hypothetical protein
MNNQLNGTIPDSLGSLPALLGLCVRRSYARTVDEPVALRRSALRN